VLKKILGYDEYLITKKKKVRNRITLILFFSSKNILVFMITSSSYINYQLNLR